MVIKRNKRLSDTIRFITETIERAKYENSLNSMSDENRQKMEQMILEAKKLKDQLKLEARILRQKKVGKQLNQIIEELRNKSFTNDILSETSTIKSLMTLNLPPRKKKKKNDPFT
jgi:hypothetical protein